jgi:hypothetical protein
MEPIPTYARVLGIALAVVVAPMSVLTILAGVAASATTYASGHNTATYSVGNAPRLRLDVRFGDVVVERGDPGRIVVDAEHTVGTITRAAGAAQVSQIQASVSQAGDEVAVTERNPWFLVGTVNRSSQLTVRVPAHTDIDVTSVGSIEVAGVTGTMNVLQNFGDTTLRDASLVGDSTVRANAGNVRLENVTLAGRTALTSRFGNVVFNGSLAPGGTDLTVETAAGNTSLTLPYPTDARASVSSQSGTLDADKAWHLSPDPALPRHWTGDLGPNPTGSVVVTTNLGNVTLSVR